MEIADSYKLPFLNVLNKLKTGKNGLSSEEARLRLVKYGRNTIESLRQKSGLSVFFSQFNSFLVWLLIVADIGSFFIWERTGNKDFLFNFAVITFIIFVNAFLGFFQEFQAQRHARQLSEMLQVKAKVIREGQEQEIEADSLVVGDVIVLSEGDKVPADARLIEAKNVSVDESSLTGESVSVDKKIDAILQNKPLFERTNMVYAQTFVVKGEAKAVVVTTGMRTEVGKIFSSLSKTKDEKTSFEVEIDQVGKKIAIAIGLLIIFTAVVLKLHNFPLSLIFIISISLAVGAIPEGLPAVTTFVLALGSQRMLKRKFLVKKLSSIESLGSIDVIATDKTGTLTWNKMNVERLFIDNHDLDLSKDKHLSGILGHEAIDEFLHTIVFANEVEIEKDGSLSGDPTETALLELSQLNGLDPKRLRSEVERLDLMPFSSDTRFTVSLYKALNLEFFKKGKNKLFVTGAPEIIVKKCNLSENEKERIKDKTELFSKSALRVIAIGVKETNEKVIKDTDGLTFVALIGLKDPPRPEVKEAIEQARGAGIKIIMLTGDYKLTAQSIAKEIGLSQKAMDAEEASLLSEDEFEKTVEDIDIFSRVDPEFKLRILSTLQKKGHRVAMTGDGVNDAPALKKADISLAMGIRGTDLAKEVSHVILLDDNFSTIINGIKEGRTIFHNLRKFVNYILSSNVSEVIFVFFASFFGFIPLTATQILWTNFVTDVFPAMSLGVDPSPKDIMKQKPKGVKEQVLNKRLVGLILAIGIKKTLIMFLVFIIGLKLWGLAVAQTLTFSWLVFSHFIRILSIRVDEGINFFINKYVNLSIFLSSILQFLILYSPVRVFFSAVSLSFMELVLLAFSLFALGTPLSIILTKFVDRLFPDNT